MLNGVVSLPDKPPEEKFNVHHPHSRDGLAACILGLLAEAPAARRDVVILCIGTDRSTGDALGPLTGSRLRSLNRYPHVFGTLQEPVHATNLPEAVRAINDAFVDPYVVAVDACLGRLESVGFVTVGRGALRPGAAVNKQLPAVGDVFITGVVNVGGFMEHLVLQSTRLSLVVTMAETIAFGLARGLEQIAKRH